MTNKPESALTGIPDIDHTFSILGDYIKFCVAQGRMMNTEANTFIAILSVLPAYSLPFDEKDRAALQEELKEMWKQIQNFTAQVMIELGGSGADKKVIH